MCTGEVCQTLHTKSYLIWKKILRQKPSTFATELKKRKITSKDGKIQAVGIVRDVFGCILHLSLEKKLDMAIVLQFPLTSVPLPLSHADGTMLSTSKSKLLNQLEPLSGTLNPTNINVTIIDAMFLLHLMPPSLPATFGRIAEHILKTVCKFQGSIIHFVSDKTISPSIKDAERECRSSDSCTSAFSICGPCQKRPPNWLNALINDNFKNSLIEFLINAWRSTNEYSTILGDKVLYANVGDMCYSIKVLNGVVSKRVKPLLFSSHEEADSRILFHMTASDTKGEVVIHQYWHWYTYHSSWLLWHLQRKCRRCLDGNGYIQHQHTTICWCLQTLWSIRSTAL